MNRDRVLTGTNGYAHDLKFNPFEFLRERILQNGAAGWLDLCCGAGNALAEGSRTAEEEGIGSDLTIVGVDLVGMFGAAARERENVTLIEAALSSWEPERQFDLITCVHGLHYIGDKLGLIGRAVSWLNEGGLFAAHLDLENLVVEGKNSARRKLLSEFRKNSLEYDRRRKIVRGRGRRRIEFALKYVGGDDTAGPNFTGQPAVNSHYRVV
jgi:trans-aconitate methyltransferase